MDFGTSLQQAYAESKTYPALVKRLIQMGVRSYTVDVSSSTMLYRTGNGHHHVHFGSGTRKVAEAFDEEKVKRALSRTQSGETNYAQFVEEIAAAGVRFYEATLEGEKRRVTYIGARGCYEELIPVVD